MEYEGSEVISIYKVKGKMIKHNLLLKRAELLPYLPETNWFTADKALAMLKRYSMIFIKPNSGSGGVGIIRVRRVQNGYEIRNGSQRRQVGLVPLYKIFQSYQKSAKKYIVQRGHKLARNHGKIFDVRMYLQKPQAKWVISGMVARIAAPNQYVTNHHQGGRAEPLTKVLINLFGNNTRRMNQCIFVLKKISKMISYTLDKRFPDIRELGIDLGIDKNGHIWFIEANSRPFHRLFTQLPDKKMLRTIRRNKRIIKRR